MKAITRLRRLARTAVSETWQVSVAGQLAVFRQDLPGAARLGLDRASELAVLRAAYREGLGPAVLDTDPDTGLLLTTWLPGEPCTAATLRNPAQLAAAGSLLRRLHAVPWNGPALDLAAAIERYGRLAGVDAGALVADSVALLAAAPVISPTGDALCLCHNDPSPGNLILAADPGPPQLSLVDWEYAARHVPWFDLAVLASEAGQRPAERPAERPADGTGPDLRVALLSAYLGRPPDDRERRTLRDWMDFYGKVAALWHLALRSLGTAGPDPDPVSGR